MGFLIGQIAMSSAIVAFVSWILAVWIFKGPYRHHHTRTAISVVPSWFFFGYLISLGPNGLEGFLPGVVMSGPLVLGIWIFANPPPLEDEEENGEEPSESDHLQT